jgi:hypothetical protein
MSHFIPEPRNRFVLSGWRYRLALRFSMEHRSYFGPTIGKRLGVSITEDDATIDFDQVIQKALERRKYFPFEGPVTRYEKALEAAEYFLGVVRAELNRVLAEAIAARHVAKNWNRWNELDRAVPGYHPCIVVELEPRRRKLLQAAE